MTIKMETARKLHFQLGVVFWKKRWFWVSVPRLAQHYR